MANNNALLLIGMAAIGGALILLMKGGSGGTKFHIGQVIRPSWSTSELYTIVGISAGYYDCTGPGGLDYAISIADADANYVLVS